MRRWPGANPQTAYALDRYIDSNSNFPDEERQSLLKIVVGMLEIHMADVALPADPNHHQSAKADGEDRHERLFSSQSLARQ